MGAFVFCFGFFFIYFTFITLHIFPCFQLEARPVCSVQLQGVEVPGTESLSPSPLSVSSPSQGGFASHLSFWKFPASLSLIGVCSFSISCLLRILRNFLFSTEQEKFATGPPRPWCLTLLRSPNVSHRFMTAWTVTAVGFSLIPLSPVWRRGSMRSAETRRSSSSFTSWYVPLLSRGWLLWG